MQGYLKLTKKFLQIAEKRLTIIVQKGIIEHVIEHLYYHFSEDI